MQPVLERFVVAVGRQRLVNLDEDVLGYVFGQRDLAERSEGNVDHQPVIAEHELAEGLLVPRRAPIDQPALLGIPLG